MKTYKVGIVVVAILVVVAIARTSTAGDFNLGDFKGTYVSGLPGNTLDGNPINGVMYLVADGEGHATVRWSYWSLITSEARTSLVPEGSYTVSETGLVVVSGAGDEGTYNTTVYGYLANNNEEILGILVINFSGQIINATVHGVKQ